MSGAQPVIAFGTGDGGARTSGSSREEERLGAQQDPPEQGRETNGESEQLHWKGDHKSNAEDSSIHSLASCPHLQRGSPECFIGPPRKGVELLVEKLFLTDHYSAAYLTPMKLFSQSIISALIILGSASLEASTLSVNNLVDGVNDTLFTGTDNNPMNSGLAAIGYFDPGVTPTSHTELVSSLTSGQWTSVDSGVPGVGGLFPTPGYLVTAGQSTVTVTGADPLLNRPIYLLVSDNSNLASVTGTTGLALMFIENHPDDVPFAQAVVANPNRNPAIVGINGTVNTDIGQGAGALDYDTLQLAIIPEPSTLLLIGFGSLALLRRQRS